MKIKDLIITSIIIAVISLATYYITIEAYTEGAVLYAIAFYTLIYVIVGIAREKRLKSNLLSNEERRKRLFSKIFNLETDLANQVKATDILQKRYENLNAKDETIVKDIPFSEDSQPITQGYICPQCNSNNVRETAHYVICNDCGKRKKKSTYGVKLTEKE